MARKTSTEHVAIRNWDSYQHYRQERPKWIKFHVRILQSDDFQELSEGTKLAYLMLLLVAANTGNRVPTDARYLSFETGVKLSTMRKALPELLEKGFLISRESSRADSRPNSRADSRDRSRAEKELDVYPPIVPPQPSPVINDPTWATPPVLPPYRTYIPPPKIHRKPYGYQDHDCICECGCRCRSVLDLWGHLTTIHKDDPDPSDWVRSELERHRQHEAAA